MGLMRVDVTRKNISSRNTMSVIEDIEKLESILQDLLSAIAVRYYSTSRSMEPEVWEEEMLPLSRASMNSMVLFSILYTTSDTRLVR